MCSIRVGSWGMYITFASAKKVNKAEPTLALKPRGDSPEIQNRGISGPKNGHVSTKNFKRKTLKKRRRNSKWFKEYSGYWMICGFIM